MRVLGLDAATAMCGVAVVESSASGGSGGDQLLCEFRLLTGFLHAEHLLILVDRALRDLKLGLADLDGLALTIGPGSFTGLRVAVSTVRGLLAGASKAVVAVSTLEALAWNLPQAHDPICPMLDAKKQEVYTALFVFEESGELKRLMEDRVIAPETLLEQLSGPVLFLGDGAERYRELIIKELGRRARFAPPAQRGSMASVVAQLGLERLKRGEGMNIERLVPVYLRQSDAEVNLKKQQGRR